MKPTIIIILLLSSIFSISTEQEPDLLIYNSEIIKIIEFPLEVLIKKDSRIKEKLTDESNCISSACWRQYIGTWKIENDSLFLIRLKDCCEYKKIKLDTIFESKDIKNDKVFAFWYSNNIYAGFGKISDLLNTENIFEPIYEKRINLKLNKGIVTELKVRKNKKYIY